MVKRLNIGDVIDTELVKHHLLWSNQTLVNQTDQTAQLHFKEQGLGVFELLCVCCVFVFRWLWFHPLKVRLKIVGGRCKNGPCTVERVKERKSSFITC